MKKLLLTLALAMTVACGAFAQTVVKGSQLEANKSVTVDGYTISLQKNDGQTNPAVRPNGDVRLYAKGTLEIAGSKITKVVITLASDAAGRYAAFTPSTGAFNPAQAAGDTQLNWEGDAASVTFTVGDKAIYGTEGESKAGQVRFSELTIYGEGGQGGGDTPTPPVTSNEIKMLTESDANGADGWVYDNGTLPEGLEYVWSWKSYNSAYYLNASAYVAGTAYATEAYAVSPEIDLTGADAPKMTFDHAAKFQTTLKDLCGLCIREAGSTTWTALAIPTWPEAGSWTFVSAGEIDLNAYTGKKVQIGFKYGSSEKGADTWEIKNLVVTGVKAGDTPVVPPTPSVETATYTPSVNLSSLGEVVFVASNKYNQLFEKSYGYMGTNDITEFAANGTFVGNADAAFKVAPGSAANTYTFTTSKGLMLGAKDGYNTFDTTDDSAANRDWTIEPNTDGSYTITNVATGKMIYQDPAYGSFGCYTAADLEAKNITDPVHPTLYAKTSPSSVENIAVDANAPVEYFNLQGVRVANPENGLYIRRQGSKATKVYIR